MSDNKKDISEFFREVPPFLKVFNITNAYPTDDEQFVVEFNPGEELTHSNGMVVQGGFVTGMLDCCMAQFLIYKAKGKQIPLTLDADDYVELYAYNDDSSPLIVEDTVPTTNFYGIKLIEH